MSVNSLKSFHGEVINVDSLVLDNDLAKASKCTLCQDSAATTFLF